MLDVDYLILGAGLSSLSFIHALDNETYLVIEQSNKIGGYCKSTYKNGFVWDHGGHFFHFKNEDNKEYFLQNVCGQEPIKKNCKIYYKTRLIDYPFQTHISQLDKADYDNCISDLKEKTRLNDSSFLDMLYNNYGKSITELFLRPYNEKLYACNLNMLDKDAMGRFFPKADKEEIIKSSIFNNRKTYNDSFYYPKSGAQTIIDYLAKGLRKNRILFNRKPKEIDIANKICTLDDGTRISYSHLISSIPFFSFAGCVKQFQNIVGNLSYNKVLCINLGIKKELDSGSMYNKVHWVYFPNKEFNFYRVGFYNNISQTKNLSMYVEIGFGKNDSINIDSEYKLTLENLKKAKIIGDNTEIDCYETLVMDPAYVHINGKTDEKIKNIISDLEENDIYLIGRYGRWTYCSMEDCIEMAKEVAKKKKAKRK